MSKSFMNTHAPQPDDDREESVDPATLETAAEKMIHPPGPPEVSPKTGELTEWDQPPDATGTAAPKVGPDDESNVAEELVEEGIEEADRDQRIASEDPDAEP